MGAPDSDGGAAAAAAAAAAADAAMRATHARAEDVLRQVHEHVFRHLDPPDVASLAMASRALRPLARSDETWAVQALRRYGVTLRPGRRVRAWRRSKARARAAAAERGRDARDPEAEANPGADPEARAAAAAATAAGARADAHARAGADAGVREGADADAEAYANADAGADAAAVGATYSLPSLLRSQVAMVAAKAAAACSDLVGRPAHPGRDEVAPVLEAFKALYAGEAELAAGGGGGEGDGDAAEASFEPSSPFLRWRGVCTDGGVDNDDRRYWINNMFTPSEWDSYCSVRPTDVHCVARLEPGHAAVDSAAARRRRFLLERLRLPVRVLFGVDGNAGANAGANGGPGAAPAESLDLWSMAEMETLLLELWGVYRQGFPFGQLLFQGLRGARRNEEVERVRQAVEDIERANSTKGEELEYDAADHNTVSVPEALADLWGAGAGAVAGDAGAGDAGAAALKGFSFPLPGALAASLPPSRGNSVDSAGAGQQGSLLALADRLVVSRKGQFSCPVRTGTVLMACPGAGADEEPGAEAQAWGAPSGSSPPAGAGRAHFQPKRCGRSPACAALKGLTSVSAVVRAAAAPGSALPPVAKVHTLAYGDVVDFAPPAQRRPDELYPVAWFRFSPKKDGRRAGCADSASADTDTLAVDLARVHVGSALCVKLIDSENLMEVFNDNHPEPNIDCSFVGLRGACVRMPPADLVAFA